MAHKAYETSSLAGVARQVKKISSCFYLMFNCFCKKMLIFFIIIIILINFAKYGNKLLWID